MERYVRESVESILNQTFSDFEFIIIDDGSTDKTLDVIRSINDHRIVLLSNKVNLGNYPSRNKGMQIAKGKFIAVMDGDDIAFPNRLQIQSAYMEEHQEVLAVGSEAKIIPTNKKRISPISYQDICISLLDNSYILHPSLLIRTATMKRMNGYNEKYRYAADYDLICRLSINGAIECLPTVLMAYRHHSKQITSLYRAEQASFANEIRGNYWISFINKCKSENQSIAGTPEVSFPLVGKAICFYTYSKYSGEKKYSDFADLIIDEVTNTITKSLPVRLAKGLCGIGCGLAYLIRNGFLEGDEDDILEVIDKVVIEFINNSSDNEDLPDQLFYMHYRNIQK